MKTQLQVLKHTELCGQQFAVYGTAEEPLFLAKDVATWIEYDASSVNKLVALVDDDEKVRNIIPTLGGNQEMWFLTEDGLYEVLMQSRKPIAKQFKKGVKKILHEIRTIGGYLATMPEDTPEMIMARAVLVAQSTIEKKNKQIEEQQQLLLAQGEQITEMQGAIEEMKPKVNYCDVILQSPSTVTVTQIAQDYGMSAKAFNKLLHTIGVQRKVGRQWVLYAKYIANGYVQSHTEPMKNSLQGRTFTYSQWTQKGRIFLYHELKNRNVLPLIEQEDELITSLAC